MDRNPGVPTPPGFLRNHPTAPLARLLTAFRQLQPDGPLHPKISLTAAGLLLVFMVAGTNLDPASAVATPVSYVQATSINVSAEGDAVINQTLVMPQNTTEVTIPLLSAQIGDILAVDQVGTPASYEISGANITIYTLGDSFIDLTYYTSSLTMKQGSVWSVDYTWGSNSTLELPPQSTILSLSSTPLSTSNQGGVPVLVLGPGTWDVSYGLPIAVSQSQTSTSKSGTESSSSTGSGTGASAVSSGTSSSSSSGNPQTTPGTATLILAAIVLAAATGFLVLRRTRSVSAGSAVLRPDDIEMLRFIRDKGGKVVEAEIRERFSVPRTTAWRQAKRLEQLGYIRVSKLGSQNQLELIRSDFE